MLLALRIEATYTKEKILELYLNQIYLGFGNYGIAAAALNYFGKSVHELTLAEAAYLAALPKAPSNYNPFETHDAAIERRNWVLDRMAENGFASRAGWRQGARPRTFSSTCASSRRTTSPPASSPRRCAASSPTATARQQLYEGGLSVRTTLDPAMQLMARKALSTASSATTRRMAGAARSRRSTSGAIGARRSAQVPALTDVRPWRLAVVLDANDLRAKIGLQPAQARKRRRVRRARDWHDHRATM